MRNERDVERLLRSWMQGEEPIRADRLTDRVAHETARTPQRSVGSWYVRQARTAATAAAILVAVVVGTSALMRLDQGMGAGPSPREARVLTTDSVVLEPGVYTLADFPVRLTFEVPVGFEPCLAVATEQGVCRGALNIGLSFVIVESLVADPCADASVLPDPPTGPTVQDLVAALRALPRFATDEPTAVELDGRPARHLTLVAPNVSGACGRGRSLLTWGTAPGRINGVAAGERNELWILEVDGQRLMIALASQPGTPPEAIAELRDIVESVRFDP